MTFICQLCSVWRRPSSVNREDPPSNNEGGAPARPYKNRLRKWMAGALSGAFQVAEIDVRGIFHADSIGLIVRGENSLEYFHHWCVIRRVGCGDKGTAAQTSGEAIKSNSWKFGTIRELQWPAPKKSRMCCSLG